MAARLNPRTQEHIRKKIQGIHLVKRLQDHADGKLEMTQSQIDAAKFLLTRAISPPVPKDDDGNTPKGPALIAWLPG